MDGSRINQKIVTEAELLDLGYRKYIGNELSIYYAKDICAHTGNCVRGNAKVFEVGRRPWIIADNGSLNHNIQVVDSCPSGALKYIVERS